MGNALDSLRSISEFLAILQDLWGQDMVDQLPINDKLAIQRTDKNAARLSEQTWSQMVSPLPNDHQQPKSVIETGFIDLSEQDPLLVAQAKPDLKKQTEPKSSTEGIGSWISSHPLHGSQKSFDSRDKAAIAGFRENRLEERSQLSDKEYGFWTYPSFDKSGKINAWNYTEPFESTSKADAVITQQDWMNHPFPSSADKIPGQVGQGHTHPHKRPAGERRPGYESFSEQDLRKINNSNPKYSLPSYLENADSEIRRRLPGENQDTIIDRQYRK